MGACLSSSNSTTIDQKQQQQLAYVISISGELRQYNVPINVSQVLQSENMRPSTSFICNSDRLYFDDFIPSLDSQYQLLPGQIYFVLPSSKLQYRLSASDMGALALKASAALEDLNKNVNRRSKFRKNSKKSNSRISPMLLQVEDESRDYSKSRQSNNNNNRTSTTTVGLGVSMRSASVRKLQRLSSRRAKMAVRSFRKLMTIQEGSVLLFN